MTDPINLKDLRAAAVIADQEFGGEWGNRLRRCADEIEAQRAVLVQCGDQIKALVAALAPFIKFAQSPLFDKLPDAMPLTQGSSIARKQVTAADFKAARRAVTGA